MEQEIHQFDLLQNEEKYSYEYFCFVANQIDEFLRIDKFLNSRMTNISRNCIQQTIKAGNILVNNCLVKSSYKVKSDDVVFVKLRVSTFLWEKNVFPEKISFGIIYEDEDIIIVNKPAGLVVQPGQGHNAGTLINAIAWHYLSNYDSKSFIFMNDKDSNFGLVHRIDKDTSGLLIIAKNFEAKIHLKSQFLYKTIKRTYWTLVWGIVKENEGVIEGNIGRNLNNRILMSVFSNKDGGGKPAITCYKVLERFEYVTLLECKLITGRTHQIRVHMKHIGHPVFNDVRYGGNKILRDNIYIKHRKFIKNCFLLCPRQALHAKTLKFLHPKTEKNVFFETFIPEEMELLIKKLKNFQS